MEIDFLYYHQHQQTCLVYSSNFINNSLKGRGLATWRSFEFQ